MAKQILAFQLSPFFLSKLYISPTFGRLGRGRTRRIPPRCNRHPPPPASLASSARPRLHRWSAHHPGRSQELALLLLDGFLRMTGLGCDVMFFFWMLELFVQIFWRFKENFDFDAVWLKIFGLNKCHGSEKSLKALLKTRGKRCARPPVATQIYLAVCFWPLTWLSEHSFDAKTCFLYLLNSFKNKS